MPSVIEQIAVDLRVSNASVSRALNDRPGVSTELRERILQRARELNYTPSLTARGLATSQTFNLGFFVREKQGLPARTDPFYGEILSGVEHYCGETDYHVSFATINDSHLASPLDFRFVRERRIDGMILAGPDVPSDFILAMRQSGIPYVLVDNQLAFTSANCINSDDTNGAYLAADHLIKQGHRSIGVISGPQDWASNARRGRGYRLALAERALPMQMIQMDRTTIESGEEAYDQLIQRYPDVTGICAVNDAMAIGAIRAARRAGRVIPRDLSIVGFDDIGWAKLNDPPLTTVHVPTHQMGEEAARRLLSTIDDPDSHPVEIIVSVRLVQRESTHAPSSSS